MNQMQKIEPQKTDPIRTEQAFAGDLSLAEACDRLVTLINHQAKALATNTHLHYKSLDFDVNFTPEAPDNIIISLSACLGYLPFTAEDAWTRQSILEIARNETGERSAKVKIDRHNKVWLEQVTRLNRHPSAKELMLILAHLMLHIAPLIDTLQKQVIPLRP